MPLKPKNADGNIGVRHRKPKHVNPLTESSNSAANEPKINKSTQFTAVLLSTNVSNLNGIRRAKVLLEEAERSQGKLIKQRFLLDEVIGEGGMGVVYKAIDLRKVEAEDSFPFVAAKVLNSSFKNHPNAFVALQQETVKTQELAHPNIVTVHDFDRDGNTLYMTMELLDGAALDDVLINEGGAGLDKEQAITYFDHLCAALSYAHERQIIHSDFKPGNIFITRKNIAKVLDFGIARAFAADKTPQQDQTFDVGSLGALTPAYASLEMIEGGSSHYSDDVYALGCVLYEMLTGDHPYERVPANIIVSGEWPLKRIRTLNGHQWKALEKALSIRREDRWQSIDEFHKAFHYRRKGHWAVLLAGALTVGLFGLGWEYYQERQKEEQLEKKISATFDQAENCFYQKNYECARDSSLVVLNLNNEHRKAKRLYQASLDELKKTAYQFKLKSLLSEAQACFDGKDMACATVKANDILKLEGNHALAKKILRDVLKYEKDLKVDNWLTLAQACIDKKDFGCASQHLDSLFELESQHSEAARMRAFIDNEIKTAKEKALARKKRLASLTSKTQSCFDQQDYECVVESAQKVLNMEPKNTMALTLRKQAQDQIDSAKSESDRVEDLMRRAQECVDQGRDDCEEIEQEAALAITLQKIRSVTSQ